MFTVYDTETDDYIEVNEPDASLTYTYSDYLKWQFEERLELFRGRVFKMSAPNRMHQEISINLGVVVASYLKDKPCKVYLAPFDVRLPVKNKKKDNEITTVVQPDLCVVCDMSKLDDKGCCGAPDLVAEILSPGNSKTEVQNKFELYLEAGVKEYWIVNPAEQNLIIYTLQNNQYVGSKPYAPGEFVSSAILPGLLINITEIFKQ